MDKIEKDTVKKASTKKAITAKKTTTKKTASKTTASTKNINKTKKVATKKATTKKTTTSNKTTSKKTTTKSQVATPYIPEFYELPESYGKTVVKILAQTPNKLFVYWEISQKDRESFTSTYGNDFFNNSYPVLLISNTTMNYTFEVTINDFANCWYLDINDASCKYVVELIRRPIFKNDTLRDDHIYITHSNHLDFPNDSVLFNVDLSSIEFKNVQTNTSMSYDFTHLISSKYDQCNLPFRSENCDYHNNLTSSDKSNHVFNFYQKLYSSNCSELFYSKSNPSS